jgi:hypothetical protein
MMDLSSVPEQSPEEMLQTTSDMGPAIGLVTGVIAGNNPEPFAAMGLIWQDAIIGDCKECTCSVCVSMRTVANTMTDLFNGL